MRTLKLTIAYDGTRFVGWQRQPLGDSVQGLLEQALARLEGAPVTVHGAGRTDAGVHALGQVASVNVTCGHDTATLQKAINAQLPADVRVRSVEEVEPGFHARFGARWKTYRYAMRNTEVASPFERTYVWHLPEPLDLEAMRRAAGLIEGRHDFAAFQSTGTDVRSTVRTVVRSVFLTGEAGAPHPGNWTTATTARRPGLLLYEITGDGFLRHMVRALVGTFVEVGRGRRSPETVGVLLRGGTRAHAGATAPAHGLYLLGVDYH